MISTVSRNIYIYIHTHLYEFSGCDVNAIETLLPYLSEDLLALSVIMLK